mmetsp:Transcript_10592/g.22630  ORF Transcript_10592/g.22630 Transcript_10592/m.22630 type:complete len:216 (-) Transcript_10592:238-885(-)
MRQIQIQRENKNLRVEKTRKQRTNTNTKKKRLALKRTYNPILPPPIEVFRILVILPRAINIISSIDETNHKHNDIRVRIRIRLNGSPTRPKGKKKGSIHIEVQTHTHVILFPTAKMMQGIGRRDGLTMERKKDKIRFQFHHPRELQLPLPQTKRVKRRLVQCQQRNQGLVLRRKTIKRQQKGLESEGRKCKRINRRKDHNGSTINTTTTRPFPLD